MIWGTRRLFGFERARPRGGRAGRRSSAAGLVVVALIGTLIGQIPTGARAALLNTDPGPLPTERPADPPPSPKYDAPHVGPQPGEIVIPAANDGAPAEVVSRRTALSRTFKLPNGTYRTEVHSTPIHYRNIAGAWQVIDNSLVPGERPGTFRNKANAWTVRFASTLAGVTIEAGDNVMTFAPVDVADVAPTLNPDGHAPTRGVTTVTASSSVWLFSRPR